MMNAKRIGLLAASIALAATVALADSDGRSAYTYVRESTGAVTVISALNGEVEARRNLPISAGDELRTEDAARAEIALADGSVLHVGGGTHAKLASLYAQQGSDDEVSAIDLSEGSIILSVVGNDDKAVPRIDTEDATVYTSLGSRVRVNTDVRRGTSVVVRAGSVEVRTRAGSYTVRAGNYLTVQGDAEPEIARGNFSRDRFDLWAADRLETTYDSPRSASSRYVNEDYASDVQALDGYGDWDYNTTYSSNVWRPHVSAGWSPYSYGSWYYTPIGLSWWSWDPWGWYPFHYGNWFFDTGWNSWCWSPGYIYSPAWVYWGFSSGYVGWCPIGWYGFYSPWWNSYYRNWGFPRNSIAFAINGTFPTRRVDFRGWNFTGAANFGQTRGRMQVIAGTRVVDRLGGQVAVSSRPIVVAARGSGGVRESLREFVREAPRVIERTAGRDSARLEPVLARQQTLPRTSVEALRERTVIAERGRLSGPGAMDLAPRGVTVVERGNGTARESTSRADGRTTGRPIITDRGKKGTVPESPRTIDSPGRERSGVRRPEARPSAEDSWRGRTSEQPGRSAEPRSVERDRNEGVRRTQPGRETWRAPSNEGSRQRMESAPPRESPRQRIESPLSNDWRGSRPAPGRSDAPRSESFERGGADWRARSDVPPARRVIEGAVPGRRAPEPGEAPRSREMAPPRELAPRDYAPRDRAPRDNAPREAAPRDYAPPDRGPRDSAPREAAPRDYAPRDRGYAEPPRSAPRSMERAPAPPRSAAPPSGGSRSAPPSSQRHGRPS